jgi:2-hydroxychromene-2-carboxylate isomerase
MARLEFFYDCSSPWTYLAFHRVGDVAADAGAEIVYRPILVGGIFNSANPSVYEQRANPVPAKFHYHLKDLGDWARHYGIEIGAPPVFPVNSVRAMRAALVAEEMGRQVDWARAVFQAYWGRLQDISQVPVLTGIADQLGLDGAALMTAIERPDIKERLRANTEEVIARGGFGSPTMFVDGDDMYFGNDRLELVRAALTRKSA